MKIEYDVEADALYFQLGSGTTRSVRTVPQGSVNVDYDATGYVLGVEVLGASTHLSAALLAGLKAPNPEMTLAEAAEESGLSAATLRVLLNNGRLTGRKRGRDWVVSMADLYTYLESRGPQGRPPGRLKARRARNQPVRKRSPSR